MDPLPQRRPSVQLILAALAFLTGVIILVVRFGGILPAPKVEVSTLSPVTAAPAGRATESAPVAAPTAPPFPAPTVSPVTPASSMLATVSPEVFPSATPLPSPVTVSPTVAPAAMLTPSPATVLPTTTPAPSPSLSSTPLPATLPLETASPMPVVSPIPTAPTTAGTTPVVPTMTAGSPTAAFTTTASPTRSTATATLTPDPDAPTPSPTPTSMPTTRRLMLFVQGTQPQAEISYEIDDTEVVVGSDVVLPWQATIEVAADRDVRLMASGVAEIGDLRCQITGDTVPAPIIMYDSNPYPSVECLLRGS
jgi:hypothetical protein